MMPLMPQELSGGGMSLIALDDHSQPWTFSPNGYYDITPPVEPTEGDEHYLAPSLAPIIPIKCETEPLLAVIGVGYVGEHLVDVFSSSFQVLGYDVSEERRAQLEDKYKNNGNVRLSTRVCDLAQATHFLISVPTLLLPDKTIDSSYLRSAVAAVATHGRPGSVVIIESSVAVGMTREVLGPVAKARGFYAGMSPERVDPGRVTPPARAIPKVVSGLDDIIPGSLDAITRLYAQAFDHIVPVGKPEVAEMMKLYENCQRMICVAYANEMADACVPHGIDPFEVCAAAATKPFGYMAYTPGLGVGGHCIPVNPYYLFSNSTFPLLHAASEATRARPANIATRAVQRLYSAKRGHDSAGMPRILVVGIGFKPGQAHLANSPGLELAKSLVITGKVQVSWADPLVKQDAVPQIPRLDEETSWNVSRLEADFDMVIVSFRQGGLDFGVLESLRNVIVEMWCL